MYIFTLSFPNSFISSNIETWLVEMTSTKTKEYYYYYLLADIYEYQVFDRTKPICNCVLLKGHFSIFRLVKEILFQMHTLCTD